VITPEQAYSCALVISTFHLYSTIPVIIKAYAILNSHAVVYENTFHLKCFGISKIVFDMPFTIFCFFCYPEIMELSFGGVYFFPVPAIVLYYSIGILSGGGLRSQQEQEKG